MSNMVKIDNLYINLKNVTCINNQDKNTIRVWYGSGLDDDYTDLEGDDAHLRRILF
jgi:hypothetical protein